MKHIQTISKYLAVLAVAALVFGCAAELKSKEILASAAGFKSITPNGVDQQAILAKLPADKVARITDHGKHYYILPDGKSNVAYVGDRRDTKPTGSSVNSSKSAIIT